MGRLSLCATSSCGPHFVRMLVTCALHSSPLKFCGSCASSSAHSVHVGCKGWLAAMRSWPVVPVRGRPCRHCSRHACSCAYRRVAPGLGNLCPTHSICAPIQSIVIAICGAAVNVSMCVCRPDAKNAHYQQTIKQGDLLLNRLQKLAKIIDVE